MPNKEAVFCLSRQGHLLETSSGHRDFSEYNRQLLLCQLQDLSERCHFRSLDS